MQRWVGDLHQGVIGTNWFRFRNVLRTCVLLWVDHSFDRDRLLLEFQRLLLYLRNRGLLLVPRIFNFLGLLSYQQHPCSLTLLNLSDILFFPLREHFTTLSTLDLLQDAVFIHLHMVTFYFPSLDIYSPRYSCLSLLHSFLVSIF